MGRPIFFADPPQESVCNSDSVPGVGSLALCKGERAGIPALPSGCRVRVARGCVHRVGPGALGCSAGAAEGTDFWLCHLEGGAMGARTFLSAGYLLLLWEEKRGRSCRLMLQGWEQSTGAPRVERRGVGGW